MRIYYLPAPEISGRYRIIQRLWERDYALFDASTLVAGALFLTVDESDANLPELLAFERAFTAVVRPKRPPPPRWRMAPPGQLERPDGTLWTPVVMPERAALFAVLPGSTGMATRLAQIRDGVLGGVPPQIQGAIRDLAIIQLRLLRRLRQRDGGAAED